MSVAILRNEKKNIADVAGLYRHNRRRSIKHTNEEIDNSKTKNNYFIKECPVTYMTQMYKLIQKYNLLDTTKKIKKNRVICCELLVTSDKVYFDKNNKDEAKRYFQEAYNFISNYQNLGEEFIIDAVVHMDESTPHMHLIYMPVIHQIDSKSGSEKVKLASSEFWKGQNSYGKLQDSFWEHIHSKGFELKRGVKGSNSKHYDVQDFKRLTDFKTKSLPKEFTELEIPINSNNKKKIHEDYLRVIQKCNSMTGTFTRLNKDINEFIIKQNKIHSHNENLINELQEELDSKASKIEKLEEENLHLRNFINKACKFVEEAFELPKNKFISLVKSFKSRQQRLAEELKTFQDEIDRNFNIFNKNINMKGKDKYDK